MDETATRMAYAKARQARFEHGETPTRSNYRHEIILEDFKAWKEKGFVTSEINPEDIPF